MKNRIFKIIGLMLSIAILTCSAYSTTLKWNVSKKGYLYSMVVYGNLFLNNQKVDWSEGYYIAAFGPKGETDCRVIKQIGELGQKELMPGMFYLTIGSNAQHEIETITFKVWDSNNDIVYNVAQTVNFQDLNTESNIVLDLVR